MHVNVTMAAVECGALRCQRDSYAKSLSTVVVQCALSPPEDRQHGTYALQLENTVLFPEGGGQVRRDTLLCLSSPLCSTQPDDRGTIGGMEVRRVLRKGSQAVHFVDQPLEEGAAVQVELDWVRRFDHMQQHSGIVIWRNHDPLPKHRTVVSALYLDLYSLQSRKLM